jgi:hypothetical protein
VQAAVPPIAAASPDIPADFSVARVQSDRPAELPRIQVDCPKPDSNEIVVCGRVTAQRYRLQPLPSLPVEPTASEKAAHFMTLHLGPVEIGTPCSNGRCWVGLKIDF